MLFSVEPDTCITPLSEGRTSLNLFLLTQPEE